MSPTSYHCSTPLPPMVVTPLLPVKRVGPAWTPDAKMLSPCPIARSLPDSRPYDAKVSISNDACVQTT